MGPSLALAAGAALSVLVRFELPTALIGLVLGSAAVAGLRRSVLGVVGVRTLELVLLGLVGFHLGSMLEAGADAPCSCLRALGNPGRPLVLGLVSLALACVQVHPVMGNRPGRRSPWPVGLCLGALLVGSLVQREGSTSNAGPSARHEGGSPVSSGAPLLEGVSAAPRGSPVPPREPARTEATVLVDVRCPPEVGVPRLRWLGRAAHEWHPAAAREAEAGSVQFSATASDPPRFVLVEPLGYPSAVCPIVWRAGSALRGEAEYPAPPGGALVRGTLRDGMGRGVAGVELLMASSDDLSALDTASGIAAALVGGQLALGRALTGEAGAFEVRGWPATGVFVAPASADWALLPRRGDRGVTTDVELLQEGATSLDALEGRALVVEVGLRVCIALDVTVIGDTSHPPVGALPLGCALGREDLTEPPVPWSPVPMDFGALRWTVGGAGVLVAERLLHDARARALLPLAGGFVSVTALDMPHVRAPVFWRTPGAAERDRIALGPPLRPRGAVRLVLTPPIDAECDGALVRLDVSTAPAGGRTFSAALRVCDGGRCLESLRPWPAGRFELRSGLFGEPVSLVVGPEPAQVSVPRAAVGLLRLEVRAPEGSAMGPRYGTALSRPGHAPQTMALAIDTVQGVRSIGARFAERQRLYLIDLGGSPLLPLAVSVGGPGLVTQTAEVDVRADLMTEVQVTLR